MPNPATRPVLVPGLGLDGRSSARLRELVPADVVLLPGMGLPGPVPSLEELTVLLRDRLGGGPVLLVGHSQSCQVVAALAGDPRVTGLVLLGPTTDPRLRSGGGLLRRWVATAVGERWPHALLALPQWLRTGPRAMRQLWAVASPDRIDVRLRTVGVPVTVVRGTRDRLCAHDWAAAVAAAAPRGRLVELPGAAHLTPMTHPGEVAALVRESAAERRPGA
ncbi:alpha/beta fold hydrolase [Geodermatophilus poikilotrophus]|uniref:Pimeloyl-ACP methyl ester carboxylesterase n=1 Tax=Geodermatophilus poikilotrophus TaxID=1333667 RepID=A0A1I0CIA1_9ACTN|nr:alpha/beta hydrolase [Geodermatophilus poikilotrophus]SET19351.1 Pimeloyl-ACP methyl ester carboxylesterase [Geodermatophilus poikilotrophus]